MKKQFQRFVIVGIINTLFYYLVYAVGIYIGLYFTFATLLATLLGIVFSFKNFGKFVFYRKENSRIYKFLLSYILLYFINIGLIALMQNSITNYYLSGFVAVIICALLSFFLNKFYVFR